MEYPYFHKDLIRSAKARRAEDIPTQDRARLESELGPAGEAKRPGDGTWIRSPCLGLCERAPATLVVHAGPIRETATLGPVTDAIAISRGLAGDPTELFTGPAARLATLGVLRQILFSGSAAATIAELDSAVAGNVPIVMYWWTPTADVGKYNLVQVELPEYTAGCADDVDKVNCGYPADPLNREDPTAAEDGAGNGTTRANIWRSASPTRTPGLRSTWAAKAGFSSMARPRAPSFPGAPRRRARRSTGRGSAG